MMSSEPKDKLDTDGELTRGRHRWAAVGGRAILTSAGNGAVCHGDSGGPLVKLANGLRYQVGVTSKGSTFCNGETTFERCRPVASGSST